MTDLDRLIESVEHATDGGNSAALINNRIARTANDNGEYWPGHYVMKAFDGSLDAAKALHEALLPGWEARPTYNCGTEGYAHCILERTDDCHEVDVFNLKDPARAWLLAILKAHRAQVNK